MAAGVSLVGAALAYVGARRGSRPDALAVRQSERDEWGRRFSEAIELMTEESAQRRAMGRALVDALLESDLAQPDDLRIARSLLRATALSTSLSSSLSTSRPTEGVAPNTRDARPADDDRSESARLLIKLSGGAAGVDPEIVRIADAAP